LTTSLTSIHVNSRIDDIKPIRRLGLAIVFIIAFAALAGLPVIVNPGLLFLIGLTLIQAVFALSWNLLFGYTGLASFGHAGFFAIGAYFTGAALRYEFPIPFIGILVLAGGLGACVAWLIGIVALRRLAGIFLAVLTVALTEVLGKIVSYTQALGAQDGLSSIPRPKIDLLFMTLDLTSGPAYFWFLLVACSFVTGALWWLVHSQTGRVFQAIREDADRAAFIGIDVARYRVRSFMISGAVAAIAGALFAPWTRIVTLDEVHWLASTQPILNTLLGGVGSFWGPVVGAVAFTLINYWTRTFVGLSEMLVGGILVAVILVAPAGIIGLVRSMYGWMRRRNARPGSAS
jgi:branched-chain amino acid transport system permease protein